MRNLFNDVSENVYSVMGQNGAKNLIPYPYYESDHTESGITWTVNSDGSVTANGTATANSTFILRYRTEQTKFVEKNTSYILSGCPSGGSTSKYLLDLFVKNQDDSNVASGFDYGNGRIINMPDQDYYGIYAFARVISGQTVSNLTFKPMLRLASDTDNTYQPYAKTNKELTEDKAELESVRDYVNELGVKNLIPYPYYESSYTQNGITWTVNADGTITADGTATAKEHFHVNEQLLGVVKEGTSLIITGCPSGGGSGKYGLYVDKYVSSYSTVVSEYGEGRKFVMPSDASRVRILAVIASGATVSNLTFKPMLRLASDINDDTYVQYAKTNRQLTEDVSVPKYNSTGEYIYYEGGDQFTGKIDSTPTAGSSNAVSSGGTKTYVDNALSSIGAFRPCGTVTFANLPSISTANVGDMYNVSDAFTTTNDFKEGAGHYINAGANVYKTSDGKWDILAGVTVTGVKGDKEQNYRQGNINLTPANVGAVPEPSTEGSNGQVLATNGQGGRSWVNVQSPLTFDNTPTQNSNNPVKSGGVFSALGVPKIDTTTGVMYLEGGAAFSGNIDSTPTAGSNNAVASGGTKTYVDNAVGGLVKMVYVTGTTSANGNIQFSALSKSNTIVIGCQFRKPNAACVVAIPYAYSELTNGKWGAHVVDETVNSAVVANTTIEGYVYYIEKQAYTS